MKHNNLSQIDKYIPVEDNGRKERIHELRFLYKNGDFNGLAELIDPSLCTNENFCNMLQEAMNKKIPLKLLLSLYTLLQLRKIPLDDSDEPDYYIHFCEEEKSAIKVLRRFFLTHSPIDKRNFRSNSVATTVLKLLLYSLKRNKLAIMDEKYEIRKNYHGGLMDEFYPCLKFLSYVLSEEDLEKYSVVPDDQKKLENIMVAILEEDMNQDYHSRASSSIKDEHRNDLITRERSYQNKDLQSFINLSPSESSVVENLPLVRFFDFHACNFPSYINDGESMVEQKASRKRNDAIARQRSNDKYINPKSTTHTAKKDDTQLSNVQHLHVLNLCVPFNKQLCNEIILEHSDDIVRERSTEKKLNCNKDKENSWMSKVLNQNQKISNVNSFESNSGDIITRQRSKNKQLDNSPMPSRKAASKNVASAKPRKNQSSKNSVSKTTLQEYKHRKNEHCDKKADLIDRQRSSNSHQKQRSNALTSNEKGSNKTKDNKAKKELGDGCSITRDRSSRSNRSKKSLQIFFKKPTNNIVVNSKNTEHKKLSKKEISSTISLTSSKKYFEKNTKCSDKSWLDSLRGNIKDYSKHLHDKKESREKARSSKANGSTTATISSSKVIANADSKTDIKKSDTFDSMIDSQSMIPPVIEVNIPVVEKIDEREPECTERVENTERSIPENEHRPFCSSDVLADTLKGFSFFDSHLKLLDSSTQNHQQTTLDVTNGRDSNDKNYFDNDNFIGQANSFDPLNFGSDANSNEAERISDSLGSDNGRFDANNTTNVHNRGFSWDSLRFSLSSGSSDTNSGGDRNMRRFPMAATCALQCNSSLSQINEIYPTIDNDNKFITGFEVVESPSTIKKRIEEIEDQFSIDKLCSSTRNVVEREKVYHRFSSNMYSNQQNADEFLEAYSLVTTSFEDSPLEEKDLLETQCYLMNKEDLNDLLAENERAIEEKTESVEKVAKSSKKRLNKLKFGKKKRKEEKIDKGLKEKQKSGKLKNEIVDRIMSKHSKLVLKKIRIRPKTKNNLKNEKTETESKSKDKSKTKINLKDKIKPSTNAKDKDKTKTRKNPKEISLFRKKSSRKVEPEILDNQQSKYNAITEESIDEVVKLMDEYREPDTQSLRDSQSLRNIASIIDSTLSEDDDDSEYDDVLYHNNSLVQSKLNKHDHPDNELSWTNGAEVVAKCVYAAANFMAIKLTSFFEEKYQVDDKYDFKSDEIEKLKQSLQVENISVLEDESVELRMENDSVVANYVYVPLVEGNQKIVIDEGDKDLVCMEIVREKDQDEIEVIMNYVGEEKPIIDEMSALVSHAEKLVICTSDVKSMSEIINENVEGKVLFSIIILYVNNSFLNEYTFLLHSLCLQV